MEWSTNRSRLLDKKKTEIRLITEIRLCPFLEAFCLAKGVSSLWWGGCTLWCRNLTPAHRAHTSAPPTCHRKASIMSSSSSSRLWAVSSSLMRLPSGDKNIRGLSRSSPCFSANDCACARAFAFQPSLCPALQQLHAHCVARWAKLIARTAARHGCGHLRPSL